MASDPWSWWSLTSLPTGNALNTCVMLAVGPEDEDDVGVRGLGRKNVERHSLKMCGLRGGQG